MSHFDEMTALLYLDGQLDALQQQEISTHLSSCGECRNLVEALQKENIWLRETIINDDEPLPSCLSAPSYAATPKPWPWIAAFGAAAAGAYTLWSGFADPFLTRASASG